MRRSYQAAEAAEERLAELRDAATGRLTIGLSTGLPVRQLLAALQPMLAAQSGLSVHLVTSRSPRDLVEASTDMIIWAGELPSTSDVVCRLAEWEQVLCGAPDYLAQRGIPDVPEDLAAHDVVGRDDTGETVIDFTGPGGAHVRVRQKTRIAASGVPPAVLAAAGLGLAVDVGPAVERRLFDGSLLRVLPAWSLPVLPIVLLMPARARQPTRVRHGVDAIRAAFGATKSAALA